MKVNEIPLSLYIHIPWCIKKCPYCDFNSYAAQEKIPEADYIERLITDLKFDLPLAFGRRIKSIFFGGGTPSLFSPRGIERILDIAASFLILEPNIEITLEANPGTVEHKLFSDYRKAGVNRISLGAQSFQESQLKRLGRIHQASETQRAIEDILQANFKSYNIDLMYGLPEQTVEDALFDLKTALDFSPSHLSWYNLTIEPNTIFHQKRPALPPDEIIADMEEAGKNFIASHGLNQYEVSAFSREKRRCSHNLNYWEFGDYIGIGAGAHGKITDLESGTITRYWKTRFPKSYLNKNAAILAGSKVIPKAELPLEFMLNALRLTNGVSISSFEERTLLPISCIEKILQKGIDRELLLVENGKIIPTTLGRRFLNNLVELFL